MSERHAGEHAMGAEFSQIGTPDSHIEIFIPLS